MDVKEILDKHNIDYGQTTKDYVISCLSPEHEDSNPSCSVDKLSGIFKCWSCGFSGNIYQFFNIENYNLRDIKASQLLNKIQKIQLDKPQIKPLDSYPIESDFRGISKETLDKFGAFLSDDEKFGMEGRIIFPLYDISGDIQMFIGRYMYSELSPKYYYYPENKALPLYPDNPDIINNSIILVEGIFDMLNLYDKGLTNAVACNGINMGTVKKQNKKKKNIEKLMTYKFQGVNTIFIMFDGDEAGKGAAEGLEEYISGVFNTEIISLKDGFDPGMLTQVQVDKLRNKLYG